MEFETSEQSSESSSSPQREYQRGRGRGRPRRMRGGRGRPRSRQTGQERPTVQPIRGRRRRGQPDIDRASAALEERRRDIERRVESLSPEQMRDTLQRVVRENPEYLFTILDSTQPSAGGSGHPPPEGSQQPSWCSCTFCREMPTQRERLCCKRNQDSCVSRVPDFDVLILNEAVLALARLYRQGILAQPEDEDRNKANRHTAYRQFVLWHHGKLGAGNRRVIPSCCIWKIRDQFPDRFGNYVGFLDDPLQ
ncbi:uncharacterized protein LOC134243685 [Saccostrea cucullata]|uniref:uncharacterized protein LOC134243685 n=1 Tax=Saccostrea cuccullata TaxID=36930 RepID=UPI002ED178E1